ncbi:MAG: hypothetical protein WC119_07405 [Synergistaceae bacterium]
MGILDLLIEKKDLKAYIDFRIAWLKIEDRKAIMNLPPEKREFAHARIAGRVAELYQLRKVIGQGKMKERSKAYCALLENENDGISRQNL